jgi:hypothetical protein
VKDARKFVLVIDQTRLLTAAELVKALTRTAAGLDSGRARMEGGLIRGSDSRVIGSYRWEAQERDEPDEPEPDEPEPDEPEPVRRRRAPRKAALSAQEATVEA